MTASHSLRLAQLKQRARAQRERLGALLLEGGEPYAALALRAREVPLDEQKLTLALAGQYTAGKSTLIHALTGAEVEIAAGPSTTKVTHYPYKDLHLVDMPGTLSGQFEHDELARKAIAEADLVLFVISVKLFDTETLPYFRMTAEGLGKKGQMLLVVNKFDQFNLAGRTLHEAYVFLKSTLAEEIAPLPIEPFGPVVVSARDYLAAQKLTDETRRARRLAESRFETLFEAIDRFTLERGLLGQAARPLQQLIDIAHDAKALALTDDPATVNAEAFARRRAFIIEEARSFARTELQSLRDKARAELVRPCERVLKALDKKAAPEEIDAIWSEVNAEAERVSEKTGREFEDLVERLQRDLAQRLEELDASPVAKKVVVDFSIGLEKPEFGAAEGSLPRSVRDSLLSAAKSGAKGVAKNSKKVGEAVAKVYKFFGGNFKPWGKVKLGRALGTAGKVLGPLLVGLEVYLNYRDEMAKEAAELEMRKARADVRAQFDSEGSQFYDLLREQSDELLRDLYDEPLAEARALSTELVRRSRARSALAAKLDAFEHECLRALDEANVEAKGGERTRRSR